MTFGDNISAASEAQTYDISGFGWAYDTRKDGHADDCWA
jgi:hypothetical protein